MVAMKPLLARRRHYGSRTLIAVISYLSFSTTTGTTHTRNQTPVSKHSQKTTRTQGPDYQPPRINTRFNCPAIPRQQRRFDYAPLPPICNLRTNRVRRPS